MLKPIEVEQGRAILLVHLLLMILQRAQECEMSQATLSEVKPTGSDVEPIKLFKPLFLLGQTCSTPSVMALLDQYDTPAFVLLRRHVSGDWGQVCEEDGQTNEEAVKHGFRIMSVYHIGKHIIWVITEADRSVTTLLLPEEY